MERWSGKVAIVTGACVGIGASITKTLVEKGLKVVGFARRTDRIQELSATLLNCRGQLFGVRCDITNEDSILKSFKWVLENLGPVHILINNAGLTKSTNLTDGSTEAWRRVFDINVMALCICTREAIRIMKENGIDGHIIHMNSIAGHYVPFMTQPNMNVYPASKFAVTALTESLRQELRFLGSRIKVTSISPGKICNSEEVQNEETCSSREESTVKLKPDDVSEAIIYVLSTGPNVQVHELTMHPLGELF